MTDPVASTGAPAKHTDAVTVREARPDELAAAGAVVADAYRVLYGDRFGDYLDQIRDPRRRARHCPILVAVDGAGSILGCVTYVTDNRNPYAEIEVEGEAGFRMLGVAPAAQRRGIGERLVAACIERARAAGRRGIAITSSTESTASHRLYLRMGFRRVPERDFAPRPDVQLLAFVLDLTLGA